MPAATFLIMPVRTISWWLMTSASAGTSRVVYRWYRLQRMLFPLFRLHPLEQAGAVSHALHHLLFERAAAAVETARGRQHPARAVVLPRRQQRHPEVGERGLG